MSEIQFILGGIRSGKSRHAEELARSWEARTGAIVTYIATSNVLDDEMRGRVARHRARRPSTWRTIESPTEIPAVMDDQVDRDNLVLIDCVNMYVSNLLLQMEEDIVEGVPQEAIRQVVAAVDELMAALKERSGPAILVSNEVGMAPVALTPLGRVFQDSIGLAHQRVAEASTDVFLMVAGLSQRLK